MKLSLLIDGQEKTFNAPFISARMLRAAIALSEKLKTITVETLDEMVHFAVDVFGKQFTFDEFYDGVHAPEMIDTLTEVIHAVTGAVQPQGGSASDFLKE